MNSAPGFGRESSCGKPVGQNGVLTGAQPCLPLGLADAPIFALARTCATFKWPPSAKGGRLYVYVPFLSVVVTTGVTPLPDSSASQDGKRGSRRYFRRSQPFGPDSLSTAPNTRSAASHSCRCAPGILRRPSGASPAPDVFRSAPCTDLTDAL
ncbi:hypothetical protein CRG98_034312 [Punica granatum]|uniref:Uncharacterized protein n=1 Tax=Punica granatum TaxID=22663 RepID=A0A2I0IMQ9_PUNGR|nr:hypothetical protein CRG98_034312 [Punica granatum]